MKHIKALGYQILVN